jgi:hypothetical protein
METAFDPRIETRTETQRSLDAELAPRDSALPRERPPGMLRFTKRSEGQRGRQVARMGQMRQEMPPVHAPRGTVI